MKRNTGATWTCDVGYERFLGPEIFFSPEIFNPDYNEALPEVSPPSSLAMHSVFTVRYSYRLLPSFVPVCSWWTNPSWPVPSIADVACEWRWGRGKFVGSRADFSPSLLSAIDLRTLC